MAAALDMPAASFLGVAAARVNAAASINAHIAVR